MLFLDFDDFEAFIKVVQQLECFRFEGAPNVPILIVFLDAVDIEVVKSSAEGNFTLSDHLLLQVSKLVFISGVPH